jgi:hypothetical protein
MILWKMKMPLVLVLQPLQLPIQSPYLRAFVFSFYFYFALYDLSIFLAGFDTRSMDYWNVLGPPSINWRHSLSLSWVHLKYCDL